MATEFRTDGPRPEEDLPGWTEYVSAARALAAAEGEIPGDSEHCVTCGDERHGKCGIQWTGEGRHDDHRCHLAPGHGEPCECCCGARRPAPDRHPTTLGGHADA
jgi:hypothetical protein